jgi:UDP-N-acetylglucosamine 2-epimerase (non-hydrolysing)
VGNTVIHVVGARPNFMKAAPVIRGLEQAGVPQTVVHTGQHYDERMSDVFFRQLELPEPDINLGVGSGTHAAQTAALLEGLEGCFEDVRPELVTVYGDVNSTLAAALVASKLHIPVAHVEAGLRSFDMTMPEEVNRRVTDTLSDLLFVTSPEALAHLASEGVPADKMHLVGNPMIDTLLRCRDRFRPDEFRREYGLDGEYGIVTMHRPANVDSPEAAADLVAALTDAATMLPLVMPLHPRGRRTLEAAGLRSDAGIRVVDPLGYIEFLSGVSGAAAVITDSGGIQEETTILDVPCITVRPNTERPITVTHGTNQLSSPDEVAKRLAGVLETGGTRREPPPLWDGNAGVRIAEGIVAQLSGGVTMLQDHPDHGFATATADSLGARTSLLATP